MILGDGCLSGGPLPISMAQKKIMATVGIRKVIDVVDDRMLIFDPPETNPIAKMQRNAFPNSFKGSRIREHKFVFDRVFNEDATQNEVYLSTTRPLLDSVLDGYNATIFAYGATGCGKTHTIVGTTESPGVIFLTMKELYERINEMQDRKIVDVSLSYLEIYNETIRDLLAPKTDFKRLVIREDSNQKISVSNLSCHRPESVDEVMHLILQGNTNRTSSPTEANATSSRSHAVLQINVVQKNRTGDIKEEHTFATLSIIDLAGSERAAATKNRGARLNEGANINKSLLALGNCINALCDPRRRNHVPYRDSKLTRLLKFSLGGNCKTVMIVCVSPSSHHYDETLNTLKYADRAKEIKTKVMRNQQNLDRHVGSYLKMITEQKQEIEELRAREGKVVEADRERQKRLGQVAHTLLQECIASIKRSLSRHSQERCKRCLLLAKRKLLLIQKVEIEQLLSSSSEIVMQSQPQSSQEMVTIFNLCEQIVSKVDVQVQEIEELYTSQYEIDYILSESAMQTLLRNQNEEGWSEFHTTIYYQSIEALKRQVHVDQLVKSSALFDQLISSMREYLYLPRSLSGPVPPQQMIAMLENLVNGDFETQLQLHANEYMREHDWFSQLADDFAIPMIHLQEQDPNLYGSQPAKKPRISNLNPNLNSSPTNNVNKTSKPPLKRIKSSPTRKFKKLHFKPQSSLQSDHGDGGSNRPPTAAATAQQFATGDAMDSSLDEVVMQDTSTIAMLDDPINHSPSIKRVSFSDLDLKFNPQLESPPSPPKLKTQLKRSSLSRKLTHDLRQGKMSKSDDASSRDQVVENDDSQSTISLTESKMPLLDTSAASKIATTLD
ncbi:uncharacterized protein LODBEIA_P33920 [Lodderomyces beijingensis]|uniref:Kinesin-like protein n=1 Tax=Lodderomyces beijingensis TaxID=1775926 RepID=A0ABP0ZNB1_9ASCO